MVFATGVPRSSESASLEDPTVGICLGPYGGPRGGALSYQRGTYVEDVTCVYTVTPSIPKWDGGVPPGEGHPHLP